MKTDSLKQFVTLQQSLLKEKAGLQARMAEIDKALGVAAAASGVPVRKGLPRIPNPMSLKSAVVKVTSVKPLTKSEILEAIAKLGYRFAAKDPTNSLNVVLYTDKQFKHENGRFSPARR